MSRNRFDQIWRYLHLSDNAAADGSDKLYKLRWIMNFLNDKFMTVYMPDGHFTLDESMTKFKRRLQFRQYMPAKPIKWGVKVWTLAESTTGYMSRFQVYTGREHYWLHVPVPSRHRQRWQWPGTWTVSPCRHGSFHAPPRHPRKDFHGQFLHIANPSPRSLGQRQSPTSYNFRLLRIRRQKGIMCRSLLSVAFGFLPHRYDKIAMKRSTSS